jgi:hypothetical protein
MQVITLCIHVHLVYVLYIRNAVFTRFLSRKTHAFVLDQYQI